MSVIPRMGKGSRTSVRLLSLDVAPVIGNSRSILGQLNTNDLDLGIVGEETSTDNGLILEPWMTDQMVIIAPPDHILSRTPMVSPDDVLAEPLILREPGSSTSKVFMAYLQARGLKAVPTLELSNTEAVKQAVAEGLCLAVVSLLTVRAEIKVGRFQALNVPELRLERQLYVARHTGNGFRWAAQHGSVSCGLPEATSPSLCKYRETSASVCVHLSCFSLASRQNL